MSPALDFAGCCSELSVPMMGSMGSRHQKKYRPAHLGPDDLMKIPDGYRMPVMVMRDNNGWTAIAMPFDVAGWGESTDDAIRDVLVLVEEYLLMGFREGKTIDDQTRRAPARLWLRMIGHTILEWKGKPSKNAAARSSVVEVPITVREPALVG